MNFFIKLEETLTTCKPQEKFALFEKLNQQFLDDNIDFEKTTPKVFEKPSYSCFCNVVQPRDVPKRKNLATKEGQYTLLHALAHIEYSAVDLALDACYRFQDMPKDFYIDWMEVADDEIRHFNLINNLLQTYNVKYGNLPVHQGLFDASMKTLDLIPRMALIPRYMEANGLDSNAMLIEKLKKIPNTKNIIELLKIILDEEIDHVKKGDKWYKYACGKKKNFTCDYFKIVSSIYPNSFSSNKQINVEARKLAGFSSKEIERLKNG